MLETLYSHRAALTEMLQSQQEPNGEISVGLRITLSIYKTILEDAIKTVVAIIQYLERDS